MIIRNGWIMRIVLFLIFVSMAFVFVACQKGKESAVSIEIKKLQEKIEEDPNNLDVINEYITKGLSQQQISKKEKNELLLKDIEKKAKQYLTKRVNDKYVRLSLARVEFQLASVTNKNHKFISATKYVQDGSEIYTDLVRDYPDDMFIRLYRFINYINLPTLFQRKKDINNDITVLHNFIMTTDIDSLDKNLRGEFLGIMKEAKGLLRDNDQKTKTSEIIKKLQ